MWNSDVTSSFWYLLRPRNNNLNQKFHLGFRMYWNTVLSLPSLLACLVTSRKLCDLVLLLWKANHFTKTLPFAESAMESNLICCFVVHIYKPSKAWKYCTTCIQPDSTDLKFWKILLQKHFEVIFAICKTVVCKWFPPLKRNVHPDLHFKRLSNIKIK